MMQIEAVILQKGERRPAQSESIAAGAAYLTGLVIGFWKGHNELYTTNAQDCVFVPELSADVQKQRIKKWRYAVAARRNRELDDYGYSREIVTRFFITLASRAPQYTKH